jgi:hypothetical protein
MEEQNPLKRKTWCLRAVPHSTRSSLLFLREKRQYILQVQGLPKTKEKNNKETKCKKNGATALHFPEFMLKPLPFYSLIFENPAETCRSSFYAASCLFSATLSRDSPRFN